MYAEYELVRHFDKLYGDCDRRYMVCSFDVWQT